MEKAKFIWMDGEFVPFDEAKVHVLTHTLHYGAGAFEGIRAYATPKGTAIFRLEAHIDRLFYSANVLDMQIGFTPTEISNACVETLKRSGFPHAYLRPLVYFGYGKMGLNPEGVPTRVAIACWPWGAYLPHDMVDIKISRYIRIHPASTVADAKICGHYVNSILAVRELQGTPYHEALLLDYDGNIAEGPGENLFIVQGGALVTPPLGTILGGITRSTLIELAKSIGIEVQERPIRPREAFEADEAFFTGTAAEVTPIRSIDDHQIGGGTIGPITGRLRQLYLETVNGQHPDFEHYLTYV